jgi:hypothetical protein
MCSPTWQPHIWSLILVAGQPTMSQVRYGASKVNACESNVVCCQYRYRGYIMHVASCMCLKFRDPWQVLMGYAPWTSNRACTTNPDAQLLHMLGCEGFSAAL